MRAIIFGANGQDGFYLNELLQKEGIAVEKVSRRGNNIIGDVSDFSFVESIIKSTKPDYIFHLAANSTTRHDVLFENHQSISTGTFNILEAVKLHSPSSKVFLSGSAVQFENNGTPIDESTPFAPLSPYAVSRIQSVYAGRYYRNAFGIEVYVGYFFNHDSPLRTERHVNQKIAYVAKRIAQGKDEKFEIGNIDVKKEFNYAGDTVEAVWTLVNQSNIFEAVIGSGIAYSIKDWLDCCFGKVGKDWREYVTINQNFKPEYEILVSNPSLIKSLGWIPKVDIAQLAEMMLL